LTNDNIILVPKFVKSQLNFPTYIKGCSGLAHSGIGRRTNHRDGDSRWTPRSRPWTAGENEREPYRNILLQFLSAVFRANSHWIQQNRFI